MISGEQVAAIAGKFGVTLQGVQIEEELVMDVDMGATPLAVDWAAMDAEITSRTGMTLVDSFTDGEHYIRFYSEDC